MTFYGFPGVSNSFINGFTLRATSRQGRYFAPVSPFLSLINDDRILHLALVHFSSVKNSSVVNPASRMASLRRPTFTSSLRRRVIILPFGILILIWSPFPLLRMPPAFSKALITSEALVPLGCGFNLLIQHCPHRTLNTLYQHAASARIIYWPPNTVKANRLGQKQWTPSESLRHCSGSQ